VDTCDALGGAEPFSILGVPQDCTPETLHCAYRTLARRFHPDLNGDPDSVARMRQINAAYLEARLVLASRATWQTARAAPGAATPAPSPSTTPTAAHPPPTGAAPRHPRAWAPAHSEPRATAEPSLHLRDRPLSAYAERHDGRPEFPGLPRRAWRPWRRSAAVVTQSRSSCTWPVAMGAAILLVAAGLIGILLTGVYVAGQAARVAVPTTAAPRLAAPVQGKLALGRSTKLDWPGLGHVTLLERMLVGLPAGLQLHESPQWSFDNAYVAVVAGDASGNPVRSAIYVIRARDGHVLSILPGGNPRWSPQADLMAFVARPPSAGQSVRLQLVAVTDSGESAAETLATGSDPTWSPDGAAIALSTSGQRLVRLVDLVSGKVVPLIQTLPGQRVIPLAWTDGQTLLCAEISAGDTRLMTILRGGQLTPVTDLGAERVTRVWTPPAGGDGILLTTRIPSEGGVTVYVLHRHTLALTLVGTVRGIGYMAGWSPNGRWLALARLSDRGGQSRLCLVPMSGGQLATGAFAAMMCVRFDGAVDGLAWEAQGARLTYIRVVGSGLAPELREVEVVSPPASSWTS
jgi:DnaJ-like protein